MAENTNIKKIAILGAGAIGCYVGAHWAQVLKSTGTTVTLIGREHTVAPLRNNGLKLSGEMLQEVSGDVLQFDTVADALRDADLLFVATKSTALESVIADLKNCAIPDTPIVSLLNGVQPVATLRDAFPDRNIIAGMVPFNVVWKNDRHLHRSSAGQLALERSDVTESFANMTSSSAVSIELHENLKPIQYGKLLLNLANPINALSGVPLHQMLSNRGYRKIYSAVLDEALSTYDKAGIAWEKVGPNSPRLAVKLLKAPNWVFNNTLLRLQKLDRSSMTSMASDLQNGKITEIDALNGEIPRLASQAGVEAPINSKLVELIKQAEMSGEKPKLSADQLASLLGL